MTSPALGSHARLQEAAREKARALEKALDDLEAANLEIESERQKLEGAKARAKVRLSVNCWHGI